MSTLFDLRDESEIDTVLEAPEPPRPMLATEEQVQSLVGFCYCETTVRKWSYEKAGLRLNDLNRTARVVMARAKAVAAQFDVTTAKGELAPRLSALAVYERADAAKALRDAGGEDAGELYMALAAAVWCLDETELRRLAKYFVDKFTPKKSAQGEPVEDNQ